MDHRHHPFVIPTPRDVAEARMTTNRRTRRALARVAGRSPRVGMWVFVDDDLVDLLDLLEDISARDCSA